MVIKKSTLLVGCSIRTWLSGAPRPAYKNVPVTVRASRPMRVAREHPVPREPSRGPGEEGKEGGQGAFTKTWPDGRVLKGTFVDGVEQGASTDEPRWPGA